MTAPVVVAYKGAAGPDVLAFASAWGRASSRPLRVVCVYPGPAPVGMGRVDGEWVAVNRVEAERILDEARAALPDQSVSFRAMPADSAAHGLNDALESAGPGAVAVLGSHRTPGIRRTAPGSTAERLLMGAPGPVVLVPWDYEQVMQASLTRIAVAFIDTPDGRAALGAARGFAAELGAALELVTVLPDTLVRPNMGEPNRFAETQREDFTQSVRAATLPNETIRVLDGPVLDALADLRPDTVDLLVCGSRGYGPARRVLLGGVSSRLLRNARVPIAVVPRH